MHKSHTCGTFTGPRTSARGASQGVCTVPIWKPFPFGSLPHLAGTLNAAEADYFFVPLYMSLGYYDFEFGLYWLNGRGVNMLRRAFGYIRATWPYFNRTKARRPAAFLHLPTQPVYMPVTFGARRGATTCW